MQKSIEFQLHHREIPQPSPYYQAAKLKNKLYHAKLVSKRLILAFFPKLTTKIFQQFLTYWPLTINSKSVFFKQVHGGVEYSFRKWMSYL